MLIADQGKSTKKTSACQVYERIRIEYTGVSEELVCIFALKFEIIVVRTSISQLSLNMKEILSFNGNFENFL